MIFPKHHAANPDRIIRAVPRLRIHNECAPERTPFQVLLVNHPIYSLGNPREIEDHFPEKMQTEKKITHLDKQADVMMELWKEAIHTTAQLETCMCIFMRTDWKVEDEKMQEEDGPIKVTKQVLKTTRDRFSKREDELLSFAVETFGEYRVYDLKDELGMLNLSLGVMMEMDPRNLTVLAMGEYTSACIPTYATVFAEMSGMPLSNVFVMRSLCADSGGVNTKRSGGTVRNATGNGNSIIFGDPISPAVAMRKTLFPENRNDVMKELEFFEDKFIQSVEKASEAIEKVRNILTSH